MARKLKITPSETVEIRREEPDLLEVEATYGPSGSPPPAHLHPSQDEHFEVLAGTLHARVGGEAHTLRAGDTLDVPHGTAHQMWNADDQPARVLWQTRPAGRTAQWFTDIDALRNSGRVGRNGMPGPLAFGVLLTEYRDVFRLAARPQPVVRAVLSLLGAIGRRRGYRTGAAVDDSC